MNTPWKHNEYNERWERDGHAKAYAWQQEVSKWNTFRQRVAWRELYVEALRLFKHFHETGERWLEPVRNTTPSARKMRNAQRPTSIGIDEKFNTVPGALDKWTGLLKGEGIVDPNGRFSMAAYAKGKGKLIAAWTAALEVFQLQGYPTDTQLVQALAAHLPGLSGLDRLDKVRKGKGFSDTVTKYKEILRED